MKMKCYPPFDIVACGNKMGMRDEYGNVIAYPVWDEIRPAREGHAVVRLKRCFGAIDAQGRLVAAPEWDRLDDCSEGIFIGKKNGFFFLVMADGSDPVPVDWDECRDVLSFSGGAAAFMDDYSCKYGCIGRDGRTIIGPVWNNPREALDAFKGEYGIRD